MRFSGKRILVVEDEFLVALGLEDNLRSMGCAVIGPAQSLASAMQMAAREQVDAALLDVNLAGEAVYPAASILAERGIPFLFCSGYTGAGRIPVEFADVPRVTKPYTSAGIAEALGDLLSEDGDGSSACGCCSPAAATNGV